MKPRHEWLRNPRVDAHRDMRGIVRTAFVRLRTGKAIRVFRPDPGVMVSVYVARDGLPTGINFLEREFGVAVSYMASLVGDRMSRVRANGTARRRKVARGGPPGGAAYLVNCFRAFLRAGRYFPAPLVGKARTAFLAKLRSTG